MNEIKTKKDVRALNKAEAVGKNIRNTALRTKRMAGDLIESVKKAIS